MRLLVVFLLLGFLPGVAMAQFSPGPLSRSHSSLEGVLQCTSCHAIGSGRRELKCSSCHVEILDRIKSKRGYHAQVVDATKGDADCVGCHKEHAGENFELIRWPVPGQSAFDHARTGYKLEGSHRALQCKQCHNEKHIVPNQKSKILIKDLSRTFLGLGRDCLSCHTDAHRGQLGSNCTSCHSQDGWKPVSRFDHKLTRFPLTGLHAAVSCQQCHGSKQSNTADKDISKYTGLNFAECSDCHRDPHGGAFAAMCSGCHSTAGWKVSRNTLATRFNHATTRYPLVGKHQSVECSSCHKTSSFKLPSVRGRCLDCHKDKHEGQFASRPDGGDCGSCHTVEQSFDHSTFGSAAHLSTKYPLLARHSSVACKECHTTRGRTTDYHPKFASCTDCHKDAHAGQFLMKFANNCETCHTTNGFTPSTFTIARHRQSRFDLQGAHAAIPCNDCHTPNGKQNSHQYVFDERSCASCHRDPHNLGKSQTQCETCHKVTAWTPAIVFDHSTTRFALLGAHRAVECRSCHKPVAANARQLSFSGTSAQCSGCHEDIHLGQFDGRLLGVTDCSSCHSTLRWKTNFDHSRSSFALDGAHKNVQCVLCHTKKSRIGARETVVYRDTPRECAKCH